MASADPIVEFAASHAPVFVVGMERGGTSIVNLTLSTAPVFKGGLGNLETFIFENPAAVLGPQVRDMTRQYLGGDPALAEFRDWFAGLTGWPEGWGKPRRIVSAFFFHVLNSGRTDRILEKTPRHVLKLPLLMRFFPNCRIVGVHRHPLGVIESYRKRLSREIAQGKSRESYGWLERSPQQICGHIEKIAVALEDGLQRYPDNMIVVSYEELLRDPEFTIGAICRFCAIDGVRVNVANAASGRGPAGADPLLRAGGIVTDNQFTSSLTAAEKLDLFEQFPALFSFASGVRRG